MAIGEISIINHALALVSQPLIATRTDNSPQARITNLMFPTARDEVLSMANWPRATKRATLPQLAGTSPELDGLDGEFDYGYRLPPDLVRITSRTNIGSAFRIEGNTLFTDATSASIVYITNDVTYYGRDPLLTQCIYLHLASRIAKPLSADSASARDIAQKFEMAMDEARYKNATGGGTGNSFVYNEEVEGGITSVRGGRIDNEWGGRRNGGS